MAARDSMACLAVALPRKDQIKTSVSTNKRVPLAHLSNVRVHIRHVRAVSPHAERWHLLFVVRRLGLIDANELCTGPAAVGNRHRLAAVHAGEGRADSAAQCLGGHLQIGGSGNRVDTL